MNTIKFVIVTSLILLAIDLVAEKMVYGQNLEPLRYKPNINEDQIIFCLKDIKNEDHKNQVSCFIEVGKKLLNNTQLEKIANRAYSLEDTFEVGLID